MRTNIFESEVKFRQVEAEQVHICPQLKTGASRRLIGMPYTFNIGVQTSFYAFYIGQRSQLPIGIEGGKTVIKQYTVSQFRSRTVHLMIAGHPRGKNRCVVSSGIMLIIKSCLKAVIAK